MTVAPPPSSFAPAAQFAVEAAVRVFRDGLPPEPAEAPVVSDQVTEAHPAVDGEPEERSEENLWSRSRDFDWGD